MQVEIFPKSRFHCYINVFTRLIHESGIPNLSKALYNILLFDIFSLSIKGQLNLGFGVQNSALVYTVYV